MKIIPTKAAVEAEWKRYQALAHVVGNDPILSSDPIQLMALQRAHDRWSDVYERWCAK